MPSAMPLLETTLKMLADVLESEAESDSKYGLLTKVAIGSGVGFEWLKKLEEGSIPNPGVIRVQALHDYLVSRLPA